MSDQTLDVRQENEIETPKRASDRRIFTSRADIIENEHEFVVIADVPGADDKSVEITLERNVLTLRATPPAEQPEGYSLVYSEYAVGDFERSFVLSDQIERDGIQARVKDGVLRLHLPKSKVAKAQKIIVKGA